MICKQCEPWKPNGKMTTEQAIKHLVEFHPNRAAVFIQRIEKFSNQHGKIWYDTIYNEIANALKHRSELPDGIY